MEEFRQILKDAINVLKKKHDITKNFGAHEPFTCLLCQADDIYNRALDDVIEQVIKRIPN